MAERTAISWADGTFNPWMGCTKVSNGEKGACEGCYAETLVRTRMGKNLWGDAPRQRTSEANWRKPIAWNKDPEKHLWKGPGGVPIGWRPFVFCASLADVFDNQVPPEWRRDLFDLIRATPHLTWLLLTKRPQNILKLYDEAVLAWEAVPWPRNAAIGCTVVTRAEADRDIPKLLAAKAALKPAFAFLSMEPLMEAVDIRTHLLPWADTKQGKWEAGLDWIIAGGETDQTPHKARPTPAGAFEGLRDACSAHDVPFHFKQHGEYQGGVRVGKKAPGHNLLDGVLHDVRPRAGQ